MKLTVSQSRRKIRNAVLCTLAVCICGFLVWRLKLAHDVTTALAEIRAAGLPSNAKELDKFYAAVPDDQNAALLVTQANALAWDFPDPRHRWESMPSLRYRSKWSDNSRALLATNLAMNDVSLARTAEAVRQAYSRYPAVFSEGRSVLLTHLGGIKGLAYRLGLRACLAAEQGRSGDCVRDIKLMLRLAATLDGEPDIVSQRVRCAVVSMARLATERALNASALDAAGATSLAEEFERAGRPNSLRTALIGDQATTISALQTGWSSNRVGNAIVRFPGFWDRELRFYLLCMQTNFTLAELGPPTTLAIVSRTKEISETCIKKEFGIAHSSLLGAAKMATDDALIKTSSRLTQCALAVEVFRSTHNRLPQSLSELTPQMLATVPADPFDGKPLRYRLLEAGYVIYSVGEDGADDGGREHEFIEVEYSEYAMFGVPISPPQKESGDITFTCHR